MTARARRRDGAGPATEAGRAGGLRRVARSPRASRPRSCPADDLLAGVDGQQNALILHTDLLGEIAIVQRGGGLTQTAYALLSDLVTIAQATWSFARHSATAAERALGVVAFDDADVAEDGDRDGAIPARDQLVIGARRLRRRCAP